MFLFSTRTLITLVALNLGVPESLVFICLKTKKVTANILLLNIFSHWIRIAETAGETASKVTKNLGNISRPQFCASCVFGILRANCQRYTSHFIVSVCFTKKTKLPEHPLTDVTGISLHLDNICCAQFLVSQNPWYPSVHYA